MTWITGLYEQWWWLLSNISNKEPCDYIITF